MLRMLAFLLCLALQEGLEGRIEEILQRLNADDIDVRERAGRDLSALGPDALPLLRRRAETLEGEARGRVEEACRRIERERKRSGVLPPLRTVTLEAKERPAKEVFEEIARQAGVELDFGGGAPEGAITLSLKNAPPFRAFEEACRRAGEYSFEPFQGRSDADDEELVPGEGARPARIVLQPGAPLPYPADVVRHYRVRVTQITVTRTMDFRQNRSNAHLQFDLQWLPGVSPLSLSRFSVAEAVDEQGRSLLPEKAEERMPFFRRMHRHYGLRAAGFPHTLAIPVPPADAQKIAVLRGTAVLAFPGDTRTLLFERPLEGGKFLELGGLKATLKDVRTEEGTFNLTLELRGRYEAAGGLDGDEGRPFGYEDVQPITESGKRLRSRGMSGSSNGTTSVWTLRFALPPGDPVKEIRIPCVLERFEDEIPFEIRDIPLPR